MSTNSRSPVATRLQPVGHVFAGLIILLKSSIVAEHYPALGIILIVLGLLFVLTVVLGYHLVGDDEKGGSLEQEENALAREADPACDIMVEDDTIFSTPTRSPRSLCRSSSRVPLPA